MNSRAQLADQLLDMNARRFPLHPAQHRFIDVLQGNIDVTRNLVAFCDRLDQFIAPMRRMCIKQAHPKFAFDLLNFAKQSRKRWSTRRINWLTRARFLRPQVHPVICGVLTDQIYRTPAFRYECSDPCEYL